MVESKFLIETLMDKAVQDAQIVSEMMTDKNLGVYSIMMNDTTRYASKMFKATQETLLHLYIADILESGAIYEDMIENFPEEYIASWHNEELFNLFGYSMKDVELKGKLESRDSSILFADNVNIFYCDFINNKWAKHVFYVLFTNKDFLFRFSSEVVKAVELISALPEFQEHFTRLGIIKRQSAFPMWLKTAVRMRDRNRCQLCGKDVSNTFDKEKANFDHIIPLNIHGTNDPTNIQLTCESCNKSKGARNSDYKNIIIPFW
ncbi:HNH endonuclease [Ruminococcaceae bacterium OttesenSCG-928-A16]|nr:HNH endonuclease [Ruminococcaceae bacterium OttesenSCG-928-A16]